MIAKFFKVDQLAVEIYSSRVSLGTAAGKAVAEKMRELLKRQSTIRMIFAAAPSQNDFLDTLCREHEIDWSRVIAFHMDDYPGLADNAPQRFSSYLKQHLFDRVRPGQIYYLIDSNSPLNKEGAIATMGDSIRQACESYTKLLCGQTIDLVCMGIGENGHIAFNDPSVADFNDDQLVKLVELETSCRKQQVRDGCFPTLSDVPTHALTLTIPALISAKWVYCMVPGATKSEAVFKTLNETITTACPATILRRHGHAKLYLDHDSASKLNKF